MLKGSERVVEKQTQSKTGQHSNGSRFILRLAIISLLIIVSYWLLQANGLFGLFADNGLLIREYLLSLGWKGPLLVILLMLVAIVFSPLPSAPIALAAGAVYGHFWGSLYVVCGALAGALVAFAISRYIRPKKLTLWLEQNRMFQQYATQHRLMLAVCLTRLIPFLSFDLVSYAAGLTPLKLWRFTLATAVGIIPASFILAHMGSELSTFEPARISIVLLVLVVMGLAPVIYKSVMDRDKRDSDSP